MCFKTGSVSVRRSMKEVVKKRINLFSPDAICGKKETGKNNKDNNNNKNKIIIYTTSLGFVRKTRSDCLLVKRILRCLMLKTEERDLLDQQFRKEYDELFKGLTPPQVMICNKHIGGARELEDMVESGEIFKMARSIEKVSYFEDPCSNCAGYGYTNCSKCRGSCRSKITIPIGPTRELSYLKCTFCDEGLIKCANCLDIIN